MSVLRACLMSTCLLVGGFAVAAEGPVGTVVMMPPMTDAMMGSGGSTGLSTVRPSRLRYLTALTDGPSRGVAPVPPLRGGRLWATRSIAAFE